MEATKSFYFYYVTGLIQKLPNKTQNLGPKSVFCRHMIENSQCGCTLHVLKEKR